LTTTENIHPSGNWDMV